MLSPKPTLKQDLVFPGVPHPELIWPCINEKGIFGFRFSGETAKIIHLTICTAEMEPNFHWTAVVPVHILLCLPLPAHPRKFPSIFWIHVAMAGSLRAHSAKP